MTKLQEAKQKMDKTVDYMKTQLAGISAIVGTGVVESIRVEYYGSQTPLNHIAVISKPNPQLMRVQPHDVSIIKDVEKAIQAANLGLGVSKEGDAICLSIPRPDMGNRQKLIERCKKLGEDAKVAIRNVRREFKQIFDNWKKQSMSEDEAKKNNAKLQEMTDHAIKAIDDTVDRKSALLLELKTRRVSLC